MGNFKRAVRITVLSGKHKIVAYGLIAAVIYNTSMVFAD